MVIGRVNVGEMVYLMLCVSTGEALDSLIDGTLKRISTELDCASSSVRTQAFTLLLWVSIFYLFTSVSMISMCSRSFSVPLSPFLAY